MAAKAKVGFYLCAMRIVDVVLVLYLLKTVNIPLYTVIKRCGLLSTIILEYLINRKVPTRELMIATFFVGTGGLIATDDALDGSVWEYVLVFVSCFTTSLISIVTEMYNDRKIVNIFDINFYFALLGLPVCFAVTYTAGEFADLQSIVTAGKFHGKAIDSSMTYYIIVSGFCGILINMFTLLCVTVNGPISSNITGIFKDVGLTVLGFAFFKDAKATPQILLGISLSFIGATYYVWIKYQINKKKEVDKIKEGKKKD